MSKRIEIVVDPQGKTKVETKGFVGGECLEASKFIERALGTQANLKRTSEFYQLTQANQQIENGK